MVATIELLRHTARELGARDTKARDASLDQCFTPEWTMQRSIDCDTVMDHRK